MDPLQSWQRRHGIQPDAYRDLLSVLSSTPEAQQNISEYDIPTEHLAGLDIPGPFEVQAPILNVSGSVTINEELHLRAAAVASDSSNSWPVHTSIPATEFEVDGWNQLIQDSQPVLPNDDLLLFNSNDAWYNSQAASTQLAQSTHTESEQKQPSCTRCWKQKKACKPTDGNICLSCAKAQLPPQVCVRVRFADQPVFAKWSNVEYAHQLAWEQIELVCHAPVLLQHEQGGPTISAICGEFLVSSHDQITLWYKKDQSWEKMPSTPFALVHLDNLDPYIQGYTWFYLSRVENTGSLLGQILAEAGKHLQDPLLWGVLKLWTAHRLLMGDWELTGPQTLGMTRVTDNQSSIFNTIPAPRVVRNRGDRMLEKYVADLELICLKELQMTMLHKHKFRRDRIVIFLVVLLILHIRERDIWRLEYWIFCASERYRWRHPETADALIRKSLHLSNILLTHLHFSGDVPLEVRNIEHSLKSYPLDAAMVRYHWMKKDSVDFSLCSLAFDLKNTKLPGRAEPIDFGC